MTSLLPLTMLGYGIGTAWQQWRVLSSYVPVEAEVLSAGIDTHVFKGLPLFRPVVRYRYKVDETWYTSERTTPIYDRGLLSWVENVIADYPPGCTCEAFCSPQNPQQAFLVPLFSFTPYGFMLIGLLFAGVYVGACADHRFYWGRASTKPARTGGEWYALEPARLRSDVARFTLVCGSIVFAVGGLLVGHYFWSAPPPYSWSVIALTLAYFVIVVIVLMVGAWVYRGVRRVPDARLLADTDTFAAGQEFRVLVEQPLGRSINSVAISVHVVCEQVPAVKGDRSAKDNVSRLLTDEFMIFPRLDVPADGVVTAEGEIEIWEGYPPSTPPTQKKPPKHLWRLEVWTRPNGKSGYETQFPITVLATAEGEGASR